MNDLIRRVDAIRVVSGLSSGFVKYIEEIPAVLPTGKMVDTDRIKKLARIESADMLEPVKSVLPMAVEWIVDKALEEMK